MKSIERLELVVIFLAIKRANSLEIALELLILVVIVRTKIQDVIPMLSFSKKLNFLLV